MKATNVRVLAIVLFGLAELIAPAGAQEVYVGTADQWSELVAYPEQWRFVRNNADGLYVNFVMMKLRPDRFLEQTAKLMKTRNAFLESDARTPKMGELASGASNADDQRAITALQAAGFTIPYTSLNYGWDEDRAANLGRFARVAPENRMTFVQIGPWSIGGDLMRNGSDRSGGHPHNAALRDWVRKSDGVSTDGPLGLWKSDQGHVRTASVSMIRFAHRCQKLAMVMLSPYGASNPDYDRSQYLAIAQNAVRYHEDAHASPDIWSVFEYATDIRAVPEQHGGRAANTTMGVAFWLLHHLRDPDQSLLLTTDKKGWRSHPDGSRDLNILVTNRSDWLDFAPLLRVIDGSGGGERLRISVDGIDASRALSGGFALSGSLRLWPKQVRTIRLTEMPKGQTSAKAGFTEMRLYPGTIPGEVARTMQINLD